LLILKLLQLTSLKLPFSGCTRDRDGYYWITGRSDDMLNVSGHLLSTAQVESAIVEHRAVAEAAAVSSPHPIKGECLYCFVVLNNGFNFSPEMASDIKQQGNAILSQFFAMYSLRSEEHTSELQSRFDLVCRLLLEKKKLIYIVSC